MESGTRTFDAKKFARMLNKAPEARPDDFGKDTKEKGVSPRDLDAYVYQRLFSPIVAERPVPLAGLDFGRISHEDLEDLANALYNDNVLALLNLGNAFCNMKPAVSARQMFI
jgi:hypothetical protein